MSNNLINPTHTQYGEKRKRTRVACDSCRKRKSKCDGGNPCSKCKEKGRKCEYIIVQKERKKRTTKNQQTRDHKGIVKPNNGNDEATIKKLSSRINVLENLLGKLIGKLDPQDQAEFLETNNDLESGISYDEEHFEELGSGKESNFIMELDSELESQESENEVSIEDPKVMKDMLAPSEPNCLTSHIKRKMMQYFGAHSIFYILSAKSLDWIKSKIIGGEGNDDDIFAPLKQLPIAFKAAIKTSTNLLAEPNSIQLEKEKMYFRLEEQALIFEILEYYYEDLYIAPFLCDISTVRELFQIYFYGYSSNDIGIIEDFIYSELLIMNTSVLLCLINWKKGQDIDSVKFPNLSKVTNIVEFANRLFNNSMECYKKISKSNEGLRAVQGISLLIIYIEITLITDFHVNYILVNDLIGMAKEMGLHSIDYIDAEEDHKTAMLKRILWWFCEYIACEVSYKSGKTMLINMEDVTTLTEFDKCFLSIPKSLFYNDKYKDNANNIFKNAQKYGYHYYFAYFGLMLTRIKMKSYNKLFSKIPTSINIQGILTIINEINEDFSKMNNLMLKGTKLDDCELIPAENPFSCKQDMYNYQLIHLRCSYYAHLSSINRIPFIKNFKIEDARLLLYGNLSLNSSRKLLNLVNKINKDLISVSGRTTLSFYPLIAFCSLLGNCLMFSNEKSSHSDGLLLIKSVKFFQFEEEIDYLNSKVLYYDYITRALIKVLVNKVDYLNEDLLELYTKESLLNQTFFEQLHNNNKIVQLSSNPSPISHNDISISNDFNAFDFDVDQILSQYALDNTFINNINSNDYGELSWNSNFNEIPISNNVNGFLSNEIIN
ncbi:unnamed protein product [Candida verbasci]|uniref:Zn(2)-C6 fungal-type domain-containing protein n=1 Tax=Candida verbasci TaxID=1227364 RepID=A0A9W4U1Y7_9ASCO|nr:unnamed protein product [Candida verbasci]